MKTKTLVDRSLALGLAATLLASVAVAAPRTDLERQARISEAEARETALAHVPRGSLKSSELEKEHGRLIWSFDIARPGSRTITEVNVDARTGKIVSAHVETPADEAKEAEAGDQVTQ